MVREQIRGECPSAHAGVCRRKQTPLSAWMSVSQLLPSGGGASKASAIFPKETLEFIELKMDGTRAVDLCNTESQTTARTTNAQQHASRATPAPQSDSRDRTGRTPRSEVGVVATSFD